LGGGRELDTELREIIKELNMVEWERNNTIERLLYWDDKRIELEKLKHNKEWLLLKEISGETEEMDE
tara:strand:+ start:183 stop:383 length:201 start_codon:yes stop_codon:yes gene_type:complete